MSNVPCHQCQAMRQGGGGNQNIGIADELPFTMKNGVDVSRPDGDSICQWKHKTLPAPFLKDSNLPGRPFGFQPLEDLITGDNRKVKQP